MTKRKLKIRSIVWFAALGGLIASVSGCTAQLPDIASVVSEAEAEEYFESLASAFYVAAEERDFDDFCAEWSDDQAFCRKSLDTWMASGSGEPLAETIDAKFDQLPSGSQRVRVEAKLDDGSVISSAIEVVRVGNSVKAVDPVFWVPRTIEE